MFAARAQNVEQSILPALAAAKSSSRTVSRILPSPIRAPRAAWAAKRCLELDRIACHGLVPDLTLCIDIDTETGLARALSRNSGPAAEVRIEEQAVGFHHRVRDAYHELARREPGRFRLIDGRGTPDAVAAKVWDHVWRTL